MLLYFGIAIYESSKDFVFIAKLPQQAFYFSLDNPASFPYLCQ